MAHMDMPSDLPITAYDQLALRRVAARDLAIKCDERVMIVWRSDGVVGQRPPRPNEVTQPCDGTGRASASLQDMRDAIRFGGEPYPTPPGRALT